MLTSDFNEKIKDFISSVKSLTFMNSMKGTLAYWKKFLFAVLAMFKHLGVPTFL